MIARIIINNVMIEDSDLTFRIFFQKYVYGIKNYCKYYRPCDRMDERLQYLVGQIPQKDYHENGSCTVKSICCHSMPL